MAIIDIDKELVQTVTALENAQKQRKHWEDEEQRLLALKRAFETVKNHSKPLKNDSLDQKPPQLKFHDWVVNFVRNENKPLMGRELRIAHNKEFKKDYDQSTFSSKLSQSTKNSELRTISIRGKDNLIGYFWVLESWLDGGALRPQYLYKLGSNYFDAGLDAGALAAINAGIDQIKKG